MEGVEKMIQDMLASDGFKNNPLGSLFMQRDEEDEEAEDEEEGDVRVSRSPDSMLVERREQFRRRVKFCIFFISI